MSATRLLALALTLGMAGASDAAAQAAGDRPTSVSVFGGVHTSTPGSGGAVGATVLHDLDDRLSLEGAFVLADRGRGADGFHVGASVLVRLARPDDPAVPYLLAGVGAYRTRFDLSEPRFLGPIGGQVAPGERVCPLEGPSGPGAGFGSGTGDCPTGDSAGWGVGAIPSHYGRRLGPLTVPGSGAWGSRSFTDPALSLGGGLLLDVTERVSIRPDARVLVLFGDGSRHAVGQLGLHVGWRF